MIPASFSNSAVKRSKGLVIAWRSASSDARGVRPGLNRSLNRTPHIPYNDAAQSTNWIILCRVTGLRGNRSRLQPTGNPRSPCASHRGFRLVSARDTAAPAFLHMSCGQRDVQAVLGRGKMVVAAPPRHLGDKSCEPSSAHLSPAPARSRPALAAPETSLRRHTAILIVSPVVVTAGPVVTAAAAVVRSMR